MAPVRGDMTLGVVLAAGTLVAGIALAATAAYLISKAALVQSFVDVAVLVTAVRAFAIGRAALRYGERYVTHRATLRLLARLRASTFAALEPRAPAVLGATPDGDVLARFGADVDTIDGFYLRGVVPPLAALVAAIGLVGGLALVDPTLAGIAAIGLVIGGVVLPPLVQIGSRDAGRRQIAARADLTASAADDLAGIAELAAFGADEGFLGRRAVASGELAAAEGRLALVRGASEAGVGLVAAFAALAVTVAAIPFIRDGRIDGVVLAALPLAVLAGFEGIALLPGALERRTAARASAERVFALVDAPIAVVDPPDPAASPDGRDLAFQDVTFVYGPGATPVLRRFSLHIPAGGRVAIEAPSGAGKTTVANLLVRFWNPDAGGIEIGGVDVTTCRADDIRALIGVVPQHPYLFNGTLRDNLLVARGEADDTAITDALTAAGLGPFLESLGRGLDTPVGEDGLRLSGGQRQQVAIARLLLKDAPIAVLDEATAHLDAATEADVVAMLDRWLAGRTTLILAHRSRLLELAEMRVAMPYRAGPPPSHAETLATT
jgi:thiol reductant ABC exporter CydC subunit